jgi:hypothetical protein
MMRCTSILRRVTRCTAFFEKIITNRAFTKLPAGWSPRVASCLSHAVRNTKERSAQQIGVVLDERPDEPFLLFRSADRRDQLAPLPALADGLVNGAVGLGEFRHYYWLHDQPGAIQPDRKTRYQFERKPAAWIILPIILICPDMNVANSCGDVPIASAPMA